MHRTTVTCTYSNLATDTDVCGATSDHSSLNAPSEHPVTCVSNSRTTRTTRQQRRDRAARAAGTPGRQGRRARVGCSLAARSRRRNVAAYSMKHIVTPVSVDAEGSQAEGIQRTCDADARSRVLRGCAAAAGGCVVGLVRARVAHDCGDGRSSRETLCGRTPHALRGTHLSISRHTMRPLPACARRRRAGRHDAR